MFPSLVSSFCVYHIVFIDAKIDSYLVPADTTSHGTAGKTKRGQEWGTHLTWSVLPFPDVNECELLSGVCGEAFCENVEGSFLCVCADESQEYSPMTGQCRSRLSMGKWRCLDGGLLSGDLHLHRSGPKTLGVRKKRPNILSPCWKRSCCFQACLISGL